MVTKSIVIAAGGTGGHIFPAQALVEELEGKGIDITLICDNRTEKFLQEPLKSTNIYKIPAVKFSGNPAIRLLALFKLLWSILLVQLLFIRKRPSKVVGFGGYPSFPTLCAALSLFIPIYIHEQNSVLGRVNRIFVRFCKKIFLTFPYTNKLNVKYTAKAVVIGNLTRKSIVPKHIDKNDTSFTILVIGGSQGAQAIAKTVPEALTKLPERLQKNIVVYQQTRKELTLDTQKIYKDFAGKVVIKEFFENIGELMNQADLLVSRAGASSIAEIITMAKPSILIPFPHATDNHQYFNAKYLLDNESCMLIEEKNLDANSLCYEFEKILYDKSILNLLAKNIKHLYVENSGKLFVSELL